MRTELRDLRGGSLNQGGGGCPSMRMPQEACCVGHSPELPGSALLWSRETARWAGSQSPWATSRGHSHSCQIPTRHVPQFPSAWPYAAGLVEVVGALEFALGVLYRTYATPSSVWSLSPSRLHAMLLPCPVSAHTSPYISTWRYAVYPVTQYWLRTESSAGRWLASFHLTSSL